MVGHFACEVGFSCCQPLLPSLCCSVQKCLIAFISQLASCAPPGPLLTMEILLLSESFFLFHNFQCACGRANDVTDGDPRRFACQLRASTPACCHRLSSFAS